MAYSMEVGRSMAADSRRFSATLGLRNSRVLMRWAWIALRSFMVLHCSNIRVLGFPGNSGVEVMAVEVLAGRSGSATAILLYVFFASSLTVLPL